METIARGLVELEAADARIDKMQNETVAEFRSHTDAFDKGLMRTLSCVQFQDVVRQQIECVAGSMKNLESLLFDAGQRPFTGTNLLLDMRATYVTRIQEDNETDAPAPAPHLPEIELF